MSSLKKQTNNQDTFIKYHQDLSSNKFGTRTKILKNVGLAVAAGVGVGVFKHFRSDAKNYSLAELVKNPKLFDTMNPNYTKDKEFCLSAISKNIDVFKYMNNNLIKNEEFLLKAIIIQNNILSLMLESEEYNEILKKPSFIDKLKTIETKDKEFKKIVESLDLDNNSKKNQKKDSHKKRKPEKKKHLKKIDSLKKRDYVFKII